MEQFVGWIVAGGLATLVGLWLVELSAGGSWTAGLALAVAGGCATAYGIAIPLTDA